MSGSKQEALPATTSDFVKTHCRTCAAGLTITRHMTTAHGGGKGTYCLLLREWMSDAEGNGTISDCDRYEAKQEAAPANLEPSHG